MSCPPAKKPAPRRPDSAAPAVSKAELEVLRQKAVELSIKNPSKAAVILSSWIDGAAARPVQRKKTG